MNSPRMYALEQKHKHLKEMKEISGLSYTPMFIPIVDDYFSGMLVSIPIPIRTLSRRINTIQIWEYMSSIIRMKNSFRFQSFGRRHY